MRRLVLGLAIAMMAAIVPAAAKANDDAIRQHITQMLRMEQQRGNLQGFHLDMRVDQGTVWYQGFVSTEEQKQLVLRTAQQAGKYGVRQVVDDIEVRPMQRPAIHQQMAYTQDAPQELGQPQQSEPAVAQESAGQVSPAPYSSVPVQLDGSPLPASGQPMGFHGGAGIGADNPSLPGYAWPAYAAHPNYAAVTYPRQYSPSAWPYIGPFYPYPQVPLGWRKVSLQWDDGWWFLDFHNR